MVSQRKAWQGKPLGCKPYICPNCERDKGMLYLFPDGSLRYVCFCGSNISVGWINDSYDFNEKKFIKNKEQIEQTGRVNDSLSIPSDNNDFIQDPFIAQIIELQKDPSFMKEVNDFIKKHTS